GRPFDGAVNRADRRLRAPGGLRRRIGLRDLPRGEPALAPAPAPEALGPVGSVSSDPGRAGPQPIQSPSLGFDDRSPGVDRRYPEGQSMEQKLKADRRDGAGKGVARKIR